MRLQKLRRKTSDQLSYLAARLAFWRNIDRWRIRKITNGVDPCGQSTRLAVFIHFDKDGTVHPHTIEYLRDLMAAGFRTTFVTNAQNLTAEGREAVAPFVRLVIERQNIGLDFGAIKDGLQVTNLSASNASLLLLANDSVYGPFVPHERILAQTNPQDADVWGMTDSWDTKYHLQSYWLLLYPAAFGSSAFGKFWKELRFVNSKRWVIKNCEIGLCQRFIRAGLRLQALYPYGDLALRKLEKIGLSNTRPLQERDPGEFQYFSNLRAQIREGAPLNPSHYFWDLLLEGRMPFLKRDLVAANPVHIPDIARWRTVLAESFPDANGGLIELHLKSHATNHW